MSHISCVGFSCLIAILTACERSSKPFNWPSFDDDVIEVGRRVLQAQADKQRAVRTPPAAEPGASEAIRVEPIAATREAVLESIKVWTLERGIRRQRAFEAILELGPKAVDPLLEILADDSIRQRYVDRAVGLLIPPPQGLRDRPYGLGSAVLSQSANKIFDAIVDYVQRHPEAQPSLRSLSTITRVERIPRVIELIESSSGKRQKSYIDVFTALTYTSFPTIPRAFCGNSSSESISQAIKTGEERQRESVGAIKAWWAEHSHESTEAWLTASLLRRIRTRTEYLEANVVTQGDDEYPQMQKDHAIREYYNPRVSTWQSSVFGMLVEEFDNAPEYVRPYVLRMIGSTKHADAADFVAPKLKSADANLQHAAVAALADLKVSEHNKAIGQILRSTKEQGLALEAIDALKELAGAEAIEDFAYALAHPVVLVTDRAKDALKPYLVSHADQLWEIARSHPSKQVRRTLGAILDGAAAAAHSTADAAGPGVGERIASTRALLRSDESERQALGIRLADGYPELIPDVLELIRSPEWQVRYNALELVQKTGIPKLTVNNGPRLMGYSNDLDRHIAAFCYAKYGRSAVPVMKKAAFSLSDPMFRNAASAVPALGLIRAMVQEKVPGIEEDVIRLVKDSRSHSTYVDLLELLDDPKSASLVGEFLGHDERHYRFAAMRVIRARHLRQHADRLFELASFTFDKSRADRLSAEVEDGRLTREEYNRQVPREHDRRPEQHEATLALIELGDARAWRAVVTCLEGGYLDCRKRSGIDGGPRIVTSFGMAVAKLKTSRGDDIRALLGKELSGENRDWVVISLTTALCMDPEAVDSEVLWSVATAQQAHEKARILATVGLSKLGERRVIPLLHELVRSFIRPDPERTTPKSFPRGVFSLLGSSTKWRYQNLQRSLLDHSFRRPLQRVTLELHQVDLGLALRRLGDETLVDELVEAFTGIRRNFNMTAYHFLGGIVGLRAHDYARQWSASQDVDDPKFLPRLAIALIDLEVPFGELLPLVVENDAALQSNVYTLLARDTNVVADTIEKAYHLLSGHRKRYRPQILNALCRFGDFRGIALAAEDPLLMASVVRYLPDAGGVDFRAGHFDYNRVEEGMRMQAWYEQHAGDLRWDAKLSQFRLVGQPP